MRGALDRVLGRITMYRLVLLVLAAIGGVALVGGALGVISFSPLAILVSAALALAASWGSNRVFALLWRVRAHGESSLVTGMLVFCLFWPVLDARDLGAIALAAVAANLSKYLLAWRGRHVFNPVALGAVVVSVTALSGATWWVATPALLPVIVLGGALVVYRTGTWDIALLVAAVTVASTAVRAIAAGSAVAPALWTATASYPWLFFAAFLVTEPLTIAPRRRQRLLVGAVIAVAALLPLRMGYLVMAPEIALLVGNAVAFAFGPRRRVRLTLQRRAALDGGIADLWFTPEAPLRLRAGQWVELSLPHRGADGRGARRVFSVANRPGGDLRVVTRWAEPGSTFKRRLAQLPPGTVVGGSAVGGDFLLPTDPATPMLWIAGGIGVTPFLSFADDLATRGERRDVVLVHVVRGVADLALDDAFDRAGIPVVVVGPPELADDLPPGWTYGGSALRDALAAVPQGAERVAYVAGSPALVADARAAARAVGVRRIRTDRFVGY